MDDKELLERLRATKKVLPKGPSLTTVRSSDKGLPVSKATPMGDYPTVPINPDGPEAADRIEELLAERGALAAMKEPDHD